VCARVFVRRGVGAGQQSEARGGAGQEQAVGAAGLGRRARHGAEDREGPGGGGQVAGRGGLRQEVPDEHAAPEGRAVRGRRDREHFGRTDEDFARAGLPRHLQPARRGLARQRRAAERLHHRGPSRRGFQDGRGAGREEPRRPRPPARPRHRRLERDHQGQQRLRRAGDAVRLEGPRTSRRRSGPRTRPTRSRITTAPWASSPSRRTTRTRPSRASRRPPRSSQQTPASISC
jgi:hypothetical protein